MIHPGDLPNLMSPISSLAPAPEAPHVVSVEWIDNATFRWTFTQPIEETPGAIDPPEGLLIAFQPGISAEVESGGTLLIVSAIADDFSIPWGAIGTIRFAGWSANLVVPASGTVTDGR